MAIQTVNPPTKSAWTVGSIYVQIPTKVPLEIRRAKGFHSDHDNAILLDALKAYLFLACQQEQDWKEDIYMPGDLMETDPNIKASFTGIAEGTGIRRQGIPAAIKKLEDLKLLRVTREGKGKTNTYTLIYPDGSDFKAKRRQFTLLPRWVGQSGSLSEVKARDKRIPVNSILLYFHLLWFRERDDYVKHQTREALCGKLGCAEWELSRCLDFLRQRRWIEIARHRTDIEGSKKLPPNVYYIYPKYIIDIEDCPFH